MKGSTPKTMDTPSYYEEVTCRPLIVTNAAFCYLNCGVRKKIKKTNHMPTITPPLLFKLHLGKKVN